MQNSTIDWDDVRLFLELVRHGSARAAANALGTSHSTVVRRVERLETDLGTRLFDRDFTGYRPTASGETLLASAEQAEEALLAANRRLAGKDERLSGTIRFTAPDIFVNLLLIEDIAEFAERHPDISLQVIVSYDVFDLARHEADVALRVFHKDKQPQGELIGRKLATSATGYYANERYLAQTRPHDADTTARWIGWDDVEEFPDWIADTPFPHVPSYGQFNNAQLQAAALQAGIGLAAMPTFVGDQLDGVVRIPGTPLVPSYDVWLLSHPDLRTTARHRRFRQFITEAIERKLPLIESSEA